MEILEMYHLYDESRGFALSGTGFAAIMILLWIMASLTNK